MVKTRKTPPFSAYECPECEFEEERPLGDHWCPMCTEARGRDVLMRRLGYRVRQIMGSAKSHE